MKKRVHAMVLTFVILGNFGSLLFACGDKFLVPNRGSRSQRPGAPRESAAILIYDSGLELRNGFKNGSASEALTKAGFRPTLVNTRSEFEQQLRDGRWDAVLVSLPDAQAVTDRLRGTAHPPVVIPVTLDASDAVVKQTRKQYPVVLRVPAKDNAFLSAIDRALEHKPKSQKTL